MDDYDALEGENETEEVAYVYEYWDCAYCGAVGVRGDEETCVQCGHPRDGDVKFYRREDPEEVVEDGQHLQRFTEGPDWGCAFCETLNRFSESVCRSCGATKDSSTQSYFELRAKAEAREAERQPAKPTPAPPQKAASSGCLPKLALGCGGLLVVLIAVGWWATREHEVKYEVAAVAWEREVPIERYQWAEREDWDDQLKGDGVVRISSTKKVRRTEKKQIGTEMKTVYETKKVKTGTERKCKTTYKSTGSGASKKVKKCKDVPVYTNKKVPKKKRVPKYKDIPIYGKWIKYKSKAYAPIKTAKASGKDNAPKWPDIAGGKGEDGKPDRPGKRTEKLEVQLKLKDGDGPKTIKLTTNEKRFTSVYKLGATPTVKVNNAGGVNTDSDVDKVVDKD